MWVGVEDDIWMPGPVTAVYPPLFQSHVCDQYSYATDDGKAGFVFEDDLILCTPLVRALYGV